MRRVYGKRARTIDEVSNMSTSQSEGNTNENATQQKNERETLVDELKIKNVGDLSLGIHDLIGENESVNDSIAAKRKRAAAIFDSLRCSNTESDTNSGNGKAFDSINLRTSGALVSSGRSALRSQEMDYFLDGMASTSASPSVRRASALALIELFAKPEYIHTARTGGCLHRLASIAECVCAHNHNGPQFDDHSKPGRTSANGTANTTTFQLHWQSSATTTTQLQQNQTQFDFEQAAYIMILLQQATTTGPILDCMTAKCVHLCLQLIAYQKQQQLPAKMQNQLIADGLWNSDPPDMDIERKIHSLLPPTCPTIIDAAIMVLSSLTQVDGFDAEENANTIKGESADTDDATAKSTVEADERAQLIAQRAAITRDNLRTAVNGHGIDILYLLLLDYLDNAKTSLQTANNSSPNGNSLINSNQKLITLLRMLENISFLNDENTNAILACNWKSRTIPAALIQQIAISLEFLNNQRLLPEATNNGPALANKSSSSLEINNTWDIILGSLRVLVNVTNHNTQGAKAVSNSKLHPNNNLLLPEGSKATGLTLLCTLITIFACGTPPEQRKSQPKQKARSQKLTGKTASKTGLTSSQMQTCGHNWFDCLVISLGLLINCVAYGGKEISNMLLSSNSNKEDVINFNNASVKMMLEKIGAVGTTAVRTARPDNENDQNSTETICVDESSFLFAICSIFMTYYTKLESTTEDEEKQKPASYLERTTQQEATVITAYCALLLAQITRISKPGVTIAVKYVTALMTKSSSIIKQATTQNNGKYMTNVGSADNFKEAVVSLRSSLRMFATLQAAAGILDSDIIANITVADEDFAAVTYELPKECKDAKSTLSSISTSARCSIDGDNDS